VDLPQPLIPGTLIRRYKRFMADVRLHTGETVIAHCPNSGSMLSVDAAGSEVWLSEANTPNRKLKYTWELIRVGDTLVGINTNRPNALVAEAIAAGSIPELSGYTGVRREIKYGRNSRIDLLLERPNYPTCYVEVKNVTLKRTLETGAVAEFPDAATERGTKHLAELTEVAERGGRAVMMFLVQREDSDAMTIAADIDPVYAGALMRAMAGGVEVLAYRCCVNTAAITVANRIRMAFP
jgi:sugar fermentation stimulation protein